MKQKQKKNIKKSKKKQQQPETFYNLHLSEFTIINKKQQQKV